MDYTFMIVDLSRGFAAPQQERGYQLSNGTVLFLSQRDPDGYYPGAVGLDGMYLRTGARYRPIHNQQQQLVAFQKAEDPRGDPPSFTA